ncbi:Uncharacterized protein HZ326_16407 [Fusarium oxysporum f. sp. albedinis]|nr:Uncharacterized protein HZ326_16407 [Fusarium oxysporum f. sp. albedinis]
MIVTRSYKIRQTRVRVCYFQEYHNQRRFKSFLISSTINMYVGMKNMVTEVLRSSPHGSLKLKLRVRTQVLFRLPA